MRNVEWTDYKTKEIKRGKFHQWGVSYEEFESGAGNYSAAIVELEDGSVELLCAERIKFVEAA